MTFRVSLLIALTLTIYLPFIGGGFVTDDYPHLARLQDQGFGRVLMTPDVFGYYRPVTQASLLANLSIAGPRPAVFRATNALLQIAVLLAAFVMARLLLGSEVGAFLATLAFALTPKAHPIAVMWISARSELLMALFSLLAGISWMRWDRGDGWRWCAAAGGFYLLAIASKEPAALLPLVLLMTPPATRYLSLRRMSVVAFLLALGASMLLTRAMIGARLPLPDLYYDLLAPIARDLSNARNYLARALPAPIILVILVAVAAGRDAWAASRRESALSKLPGLAIFAAAWFAGFMLPVLPLAARSELYLYVSGFGLCVLAGGLAQVLVPRWTTRLAITCLGFAIAFGSYQMARASAAHDLASFSATFVDALARNETLRSYSGFMVIQPDDPVTESRLQGSVAGYLNAVFKASLGRTDIGGLVMYSGMPRVDADLVLTCVLRDEEIILRAVVRQKPKNPN